MSGHASRHNKVRRRRSRLADGHDPWGHSLLRLVREHPAASTKMELTTAVSEAAATLDQFYIPTRYPNGLPDLTPHEVYTKD